MHQTSNHAWGEGVTDPETIQWRIDNRRPFGMRSRRPSDPPDAMQSYLVTYRLAGLDGADEDGFRAEAARWGLLSIVEKYDGMFGRRLLRLPHGMLWGSFGNAGFALGALIDVRIMFRTREGRVAQFDGFAITEMYEMILSAGPGRADRDGFEPRADLTGPTDAQTCLNHQIHDERFAVVGREVDRSNA